jgi:hypothetical protein
MSGRFSGVICRKQLPINQRVIRCRAGMRYAGTDGTPFFRKAGILESDPKYLSDSYVPGLSPIRKSPTVD